LTHLDTADDVDKRGEWGKGLIQRWKRLIFPLLPSFQLFLTYHSYGQFILYPWGYTNKGVPSNYRQLHSLAKVGAQQMRGAGNKQYTIGSAAKVLYPAAGEATFPLCQEAATFSSQSGNKTLGFMGKGNYAGKYLTPLVEKS